jgi:hypothetical protein
MSDIKRCLTLSPHRAQLENVRFNQWIPRFTAVPGTSLLFFGGFEVACQHVRSLFSRTDIDNVLYLDSDSNVCDPNTDHASELRLITCLEAFITLYCISKVDKKFRPVSHMLYMGYGSVVSSVLRPFCAGRNSCRFIHTGRWAPITSVGAVVLLGTSKVILYVPLDSYRGCCALVIDFLITLYYYLFRLYL